MKISPGNERDVPGDLGRATEIVIGNATGPPHPTFLAEEEIGVIKGSGRGVLSGMAASKCLECAVTGKRILGRAESSSLLKSGCLFASDIVAFYFPGLSPIR